jgi:hypothetical protein
MDFSVGQESLLQRGRSPLFDNLISLIQETQNTLIGDPRASGKDINLSLKSIGFGDQLKALVKTNMNLTISGVFIVESIEPNAMAIMSEGKKRLPDIKNGKASFGMVMEKLHNLYDDKIGYLNTTDKDNIPFEFRMAISTAFWSLRNKGGFVFSSEEIAAIILHELGHYDHLIRTFDKTYSKIIDASEIVEYVKSAPDRETVLQLLKFVKTSGKLDKSWSKIVEVTQDYFSKTNSFDSPEYIEAINTVCSIVIAGLSRYTLSQINFSQNPINRPKLLGSSSVGLKDIILDTERSADEFASRNGAYSELSSALIKIDELYNHKTSVLLAQRSLYRQKFVFLTLREFNAKLSYYAEDISAGYDPIFRRIELIVETAKHAFSDPTLSSDLKEELKVQIQTSEKYLKEYRSKYRSDFRELFTSWKNNINRFGRLFKTPFEDRVSKDYDKLQESTRHLSRNPLYYIAKS